MTSTKNAEEILCSTNGKEHFQRLTRLLMCGGVHVLRETFDAYHPPKDLSTRLKDATVQMQLKKARLTADERNCLNQPAVKSTDFDITLTFRLLRTICNLAPPVTGWDKKPDDANHSLEADLARIKYYRNSVYGHNQTMEVSDSEFCQLWKEISEAILRIITKINSTKKDEWEKAIEKLLNDPLTSEEQKCIEELKQWYEKEEDVKDMLHQVDANVKEGLQLVGEDIKDVKEELKKQGEDVKDGKTGIQQVLKSVKTELESAVHLATQDAKNELPRAAENVKNQMLKGVQEILQEITDDKGCIAIHIYHSSYSRGIGQPMKFHEPSCPQSRRRSSVCQHRQSFHEPQPAVSEGMSSEHERETIQPSPEEPDIWDVISSFGNSLNLFFNYLCQTLRLDVLGYGMGSLFIAVKCSSVDILDELWKDYKSGHLNEVAEETLITKQVLEKLCFAKVKLETMINEEHYKTCREFLVSQETILHQEDAARGIGLSTFGIHEEVYFSDSGMQAAAGHGMEDFGDEAAQARSVIEIDDDCHFESEMTSAGGKLVVVNYAASWCPFSTMINPIFFALSTKYPAAKFLIVDVDKCEDTALRNGLTSTPTFQLFKGNQPNKKVDQVNGADEELLEEKIRKWISTEDSMVPGHVNLLSFIHKDECDCLNGHDNCNVLSVLTKGPEFLESDVDEELLVTIAFTEKVKLHSLKIQGPDDGRGAKTVRIFKNPTKTMGFGTAKSRQAKQTLELTADDIREGAIIPLKFVKFQNVSSLTFFFLDNQGEKDTTVVEYMEFIGSPVSYFGDEAAQARSVIEIEDDFHFQSEMTSAGDKLVVVNFAARWCSFSIMINPTFYALSIKYPAAKFLIVDTDKCADTALRNGVTSSPTFQLFKGNQPSKKVDQVNGADEELLEEKIRKWISTEDSVVPGHEFEQVFNLIAENKVPPEILARGPLALEAYKTALTEGKTHVKRVPVMLIGQERAGKTSLQKSLKGRPFEPDESSTVGINVDPSHFKLSTEIWKLGEKDSITNSGRTISFEHHAARLTVENLRQNKDTPEKKLSESLKSGSIPFVDTVSVTVSSDLQSESSASNVPSDHDFTLGASTTAVLGTNSNDSETVHNISNDARFGEMARDSEEIQTSRDPHNDDFRPEMSDDTANLVEMFLKEDNKVKEEEVIYSVLWDFAGQSVYYTTHPVFLTPRAIYLLVNNLSQNPHEKAKPVVKCRTFRKLEDTFNVKTNLDYLDLWMSSIASLAIQGESREVNPQSEVLPEKLPPVFLVCTHADKPYVGGDPYELAKDVFGFLRSKPHKSHLYDDVFVVDNTKSGNEIQCPEVARLRKEVLDVAKELPHLKEPIPIKWLKYEKALEARREDGVNWIRLDIAKQIASEECNITDEEQFRTLLDFLHDQRILIHFSDTPKLDSLVVLDPQWLIDVFKKVITIKPYDRKEKKFEQLWCKLEERGILEEKLLKHVWDTLFDNTETIESLIEIMEKFSLLCLWPSSEFASNKQYLVPSMLMSHPPEGIVQLIASAQVPPLFLRFESGQVPLGLFPRLVLQFFQWGKDKYMSTVDPQLHHNFARFYTLKNSSVILLCHSSSIEVVVHEGGPTLELAESLQTKLSLSENVSNDTFVVSCAHEVRRQLGLLLESMRNEFCWLKSMKYEESFLCPVCCQGREIYYCRKHCARGCKQEECLHFWSESELRNVEKNLCTKSSVAEGPSVQVEQFAPWLAPVGNQLTPGESDGRSITSVEGSKEIAIPDQVLEALSLSCDANEIVLQLRETVKVKNASLEQPDSETKSLIRCLAKKAKESNRLDVFQRLRKITPAGCTGPLLPDLLDIRNIPVSKARELTIDLSGGHEWQVVAEELGLTPLEIRFLDSRTLNPFDAALSFIARQRHITVGNLYDLLNELGFPVIADRWL